MRYGQLFSKRGHCFLAEVVWFALPEGNLYWTTYFSKGLFPLNESDHEIWTERDCCSNKRMLIGCPGGSKDKKTAKWQIPHIDLQYKGFLIIVFVLPCTLSIIEV